MFSHDSQEELYQMSKHNQNVCTLLSYPFFLYCLYSETCMMLTQFHIAVSITQPPETTTQTPTSTPSAPTPSSPTPSSSSTPTSTIPDTTTTEGSGDEPRKVQTDTTRCWSCNKKVGLLGFKCRCDYVFCSMHRYSDKHACPFDYKAMARANLQKANPVIKGAKVEKI